MGVYAGFFSLLMQERRRAVDLRRMEEMDCVQFRRGDGTMIQSKDLVVSWKNRGGIVVFQLHDKLIAIILR